MKIRFRIFSVLFALLGLLTAVTAVLAVQHSLKQPPYILEPSQSAAMCADTLMQSICQGDYETASVMLMGNPQLELDQEPVDPVGKLLWDAYVSSSSYTLVGECYATETGLAQDVHFEALDVAAVMEAIGPLAQELLVTRRDSSDDLSTIYEADGSYRESFIQQVLMDAALQTLQDNKVMTRTDLTLQLSYRDGRWVIAPDQSLLRVICGGIAS